MTGRRVNFELRFDVLNLFDNINFNPVANPGTGEDIFRTTSAYTDSNNTFDPAAARADRVADQLVREG